MLYVVTVHYKLQLIACTVSCDARCYLHTQLQLHIYLSIKHLLLGAYYSFYSKQVIVDHTGPHYPKFIMEIWTSAKHLSVVYGFIMTKYTCLVRAHTRNDWKSCALYGFIMANYNCLVWAHTRNDWRCCSLDTNNIFFIDSFCTHCCQINKNS